MWSLIWRLVRAGLVAALVVGLAGWILERARFGSTDEIAASYIEGELRQRLAASADTLGAIAARLAAQRDIVRAIPRDSTATGRLFDAVDAALPDQEAGRTGITIYDKHDAPLAWAGRVSDLPKERIDGPAALFVAPDALGPRLVRIEPLGDRDHPAAPRDATIVVEQLLGPVQSGPGAETFAIATSLAPVSLRLAVDPGSMSRGPFAFVIPSPGGGPLVEGEVSPIELAAARMRWRRGTWAAVISVLATTLLLCAGPFIEVRRRARNTRVFLFATAGVVLALMMARVMFWLAGSPINGPQYLASPLDRLLSALLLAALAWLALDGIERRRIVRPRPRLVTSEAGKRANAYGAALVYVLTGAATTWALTEYEQFLLRVVAGTPLDVLHFSLHPVNPTRLAIAFGLVTLHAAVIWGLAAVIRAGGTLYRTARRREARAWAVGGWLLGAGVVVALVAIPKASIPTAPLLYAVAAAGGCAAVMASLRGRARRASQSARLGALFLALIVPSLALYPSLVAFAIGAKERLVATEYAPQATRQREELQDRLWEALEEIDNQSSLVDFVTDEDNAEAPTTDRAYLVWSKTVFAPYRLTSAVELYGRDGRLVSFFLLNQPEYATPTYRATGCGWENPWEEASLGSSDRHVLRSSRGICNAGRIVGAVIVRVMLDYRTLPFIRSQNPFLESLKPMAEFPAEGVSGTDVEFAIYGWSRAPIYASGTSVWRLPDPVFQQLAASREPFWTTIERDGDAFRVYLVSDRVGIYALGYPAFTWFGHLVNLAELVFLAFVLYLVLLGGATLFNALTSGTPASGRALWREIRSSFYRKLFGAFVFAAVLPVVILAVATRTYLTTQFLAGIDEVAANTVTVAQRLVEDYAALQQPRGSASLRPFDDQIMGLVGRAIDQPVNLFNRETLQATSERDLFASRLLSTRTPSDVYRNIILERLPTFVGVEEVGDFPYLVAAAPVRVGGRDRIVTVPQTLKQQQIERQIDELDRRVLSAAVLFSILGAAIGYWMAERIADPVNRLTRATRRIARGDLDAQIASASADELGRLVRDFNRMAADLKRQRAELERTQRLEAWADMARQVAHDIKNPLTPIQLSAEHARRVNIDRGRPLSPVLDECVTAILRQVTLLRQIAAEFSSFASSPTPRPAPIHLPELLEETVTAYRVGLVDRIAITVEAPPDLPVVTIDRTLFQRALTNVVENALHAMPGKGDLRITARSEASSSVIVEVTDTGVGMDQESAAKIFEPYFSTKATGTGLGLTIAKRNVELNGGTIAVRSERGLGTTVTIVLPTVRS